MRSDRVTEKFTQLTTTVKTSDDLRRDCLCEKNYTLNTCLPEMVMPVFYFFFPLVRRSNIF